MKELTTTATICDLTTPGLGVETTMLDRDYEVDVPSVQINIQDDCDPYAQPIQPHLSVQPWLERVRNEGETRHYSLKRQSSTDSDSDFPRSRSASIGDVKSESGYSSSDHELGHMYSARSRSVSFERMPTWEQSQPTSPTDANTTFTMPVSKKKKKKTLCASNEYHNYYI